MPPIADHPSTASSFRPSSVALNHQPASSISSTTAAISSAKARQYAHLHSQLAQLNAHLADTENLVRMTAVQAQDMTFLGGYVGAMFMGSARVLGEESLKGEGNGGEEKEMEREKE